MKTLFIDNKHKNMGSSKHAVAVLIISPEGTPLVRDPKKPAPRYWKLPGGRSEGEETPDEVAVREIWEELGLKLKKEDLKIVDQQDRGTHTLTIFTTTLPSLDGLLEIGDEELEVKVFPTSATKTPLPNNPCKTRVI